MSELQTTTAIDLIPYPTKPLLHENMTFEAIISCLNWNDNNPDPKACLTQEELQVLINQLPTKVDGCAQWLAKLYDDAKRARNYAKQFSEGARQIEAEAERLESYLLRAMEKNGFERLPGDAFQISLRTSTSVETTRPATADDALSDHENVTRTEITYSWDKPALAKAMKSGKTFDFATLKTHKNVNFSIRKG
jgi:hypothetical protein